MRKLACVVLAGGKASRFGSPKQMAKVGDGTLLQHVLCQIAQTDTVELDIFVALGAYQSSLVTLLQSLPFTVRPIFIEQWEQGMGQSLAESVDVIAQQDYSYLLVTLGDLVAVTGSDYQALLDASIAQPQSIVATECVKQGKRFIGAPAVFPKSYFLQLSGLSGDVGAKHIIEQASQRVVLENPNAAMDIDTQADLALWQRQI